MGRNSEETVPYFDALWQDGGERSVLLIDSDDAAREEVVGMLEHLGYQVAWAPSRAAAAKLFARLLPDAVVADLETIAPDFEPLRPSLEDLFGDDEPRPVILLGIDAPRERVDWVKAAVPKPMLFAQLQLLVAALEVVTTRDAR